MNTMATMVALRCAYVSADVWVVIPARGNSKQVANKNLQKVGGKTLLERAVVDALDIATPDRVVVSSEDSRILDVARRLGVTPFMRSPHLSADNARSDDVVIEVLQNYGLPYTATVVFMQCTSPFRHSAELSVALKYFRQGSFDSLFSCYEIQQYMWGNGLRIMYPIGQRPMRQNKAPFYVEDGNFYIGFAEVYLAYKNRLGGHIGQFVHPRKYGLEIDTYDDLEVANILAKAYSKRGYTR